MYVQCTKLKNKRSLVISMKKLLAIVICAALMCLLALPAMAYTQLTAPKITMALDGVKDDGYAGPYDLKAYQPDMVDSGATGQVWIAWDDDYIYYYIEVADSTPNHSHANDYESDCVEMFFDWYNQKADDTSDISQPYWQYRIASAPDPENDDSFGEPRQFSNGINQAAGEDGTGWSIEDHLTSQKANSVVNIYDGGYSFETRIAYKSFGISLSEGSVLAIDFMIGDNQEGEGRTQCTWLDIEYSDNNHWQWPLSCGGELTLLGAPVAPAEPEPEPEDEAPVPEPDAAAPAPAPAPAPTTGNGAVMIFVLLAAAGGFVFARSAKNRA